MGMTPRSVGRAAVQTRSVRVRNRNVTSRFRQETKVNFQSISTNVPALQWSESEDETDDDEVDGVDPVARLRLRLLAKAV